MIRINLLPEEYRRSSRTSPKVFAAILVSVMIVCGMFGWFGYIYFGDLGVLQVARAEDEELLASRNKRVQYYKALVTEKSDYTERAQTITEIAQSRVLWTEVLDQLIDTVNNDGDIDRHMAWFKSMTVKDGGAKSGAKVSLPAYVQGNDVRRLADFHEDLEQTPFFRWVAAKSLPSGQVQTTPNKKPAESLFFGLDWTFKPRSEWVFDQK